MKTEVTLAEPKPRRSSERLRSFERVPRLFCPTPAPFVVRQARERVQNAVEIGRDRKPEHFEIVADVHDRRNVRGIDCRHDSSQETSAADAAGQARDLHEASTRSSFSR